MDQRRQDTHGGDRGSARVNGHVSGRTRQLALHVGSALVVVIGVTLLAYLLAYLSPADAATRYYTDHGVVPTQGQLEAKRHELGLDRPFHVQYLSWIASLLQGDLGSSYRNGRLVSNSLMSCLPYTLALAFSSLAVTLAVSVPLGLLCAYRKDGLLDHVVRLGAYALCSLPMFLVSLLLLYVLSVRLHMLAVRATRDVRGIIMPTLAMSVPLSAWYVRQIRSIALEQLESTYVEGLRSRGVSERCILFRHVLRNSLVPVLSLVGLSMGSLLGGSAIVESIFNWPGVGNLSVAAITARDYPVIQGYALLMALVYLAVNLLVDIAYRLVDPRIAEDGD